MKESDYKKLSEETYSFHFARMNVHGKKYLCRFKEREITLATEN